MAKKYFTDESLSTFIDEIKSGDAESLASAKSYTDTEVAKKANSSHTHDDRYYTESEIDTKISGVNSTISTHTGNSDIHVTTTNKSNWNSAYTHSTSAHAPSNAERNIVVGIQKNGTDLTVDSNRKVNITVPTTAADVGAAASGHKHSASDITSGTLAVARGGTGASTAADARTNLEVYSTTEVDSLLTGKSDTTHNHDSKYDAKGAADTALASAKTYADNAATQVKNDLLNGAGTAYDTLKELGDLIVDNKDAIDALEEIASGKADADHDHAIADVTGLQSALDGKAAASHGTHVTFDSTNKPKMDGTAAFGTSTSVARADHVHPTDTSRASKTEFDTHVADTTKHITSTERTNWGTAYTHSQAAHAPSNAQVNVIESVKVNGTAQTITSKAVNITVPTKASDIGAAASSHTHAISDITNLQTTLNNASSAISANTSSISTHTDRLTALETKVGDGFTEITSAEIQNLFSK